MRKTSKKNSLLSLIPFLLQFYIIFKQFEWNRNYEEENVEVFAPFLIHLPQLSYDNMGIAYEHATNITDEEKYKYEINRRSLRYYGFQASFLRPFFL